MKEWLDNQPYNHAGDCDAYYVNLANQLIAKLYDRRIKYLQDASFCKKIVSYESVLKARYRLRKKLNLKKDAVLDHIIKEISEESPKTV